MENVLEQMGVERLAKSQISELCSELDAKAEEFRRRALPEKYPYLWLDALYEKSTTPWLAMRSLLLTALRPAAFATWSRSTSSTRRVSKAGRRSCVRFASAAWLGRSSSSVMRTKGSRLR